MIGSHDTMTYLKSTSWLYNNCKKYWKCQCKTLDEQYKFGIRMFDFRVYLSKGKWKFAHGKVNLNHKGFPTLLSLVEFMKENYPLAIYRIWLEKGDNDDIAEFKRQTEIIKKKIEEGNNYLVWKIGIKSYKEWQYGIFNQNQKLYDMGYKIALNDTWTYPNYELHGFFNDFSDLFTVDLRKDAEKVNSQFDFFSDKEKLKEMLESKEKLYFLDFCTNQY